jgi:hypothetical protein
MMFGTCQTTWQTVVDVFNLEEVVSILLRG